MAQVPTTNPEVKAIIGINEKSPMLGFQIGRRLTAYPLSTEQCREIAKHLNNVADLLTED